MKGVQRLDISFASETLVELAWRFRGKKGFALCDLEDADMVENWDAAAARKSQPLTIWNGRAPKLVGLQPSQGNIEAFRFALKSPSVRAAQFAAEAKISIGNASMKFKQLWEQGFLLRRETVADSGGVEFEYLRIG